ncbi:MAG: hypothetical protein K9I82_03845 [Chitinophagaceae bacterium]|nr:hypothetical protein [Chitinophagaceae bacterium]
MNTKKTSIVLLVVILFIGVFYLHQNVVLNPKWNNNITLLDENIDKEATILTKFSIWETLSRHFIIPMK